VTKDASKASLWDIRPFWGEIPKKKELDVMGNPHVGFHQAKKAALPGVCEAARLLMSDPPAEGVVAEPTAEGAGAAIHSLRVACDWVRKKTGLPIAVGTMSNEEALHVVAAMRELELPKWLEKALEGGAMSAPQVDAAVAVMGARMQVLWDENAKGVKDTAKDSKNAVDAKSGEAAKDSADTEPAKDSAYTKDAPPQQQPTEAEIMMVLQLEQLEAMGFSNSEVNRYALEAANGNLEAAVEVLFMAPPAYEASGSSK
jgi:hypothetical protein